jgi:ABC-type Mn2+/Zn2+ transport system permease subunit
MMEAFMDSWPLFQDSYLAGWLIAMLLALTGVTVVARNQIFLGAAVSQASTLGIALAMWAGTLVASSDTHHDEAHGMAMSMSVAFSVLAAWITAGHRRSETESREAVTGWVFLFASSAAVLVVAHSPMGLDEVQRLVSSSLIGATVHDVRGFAAMLVCTVLLLMLARGRLTLLLVDPIMAEAVGLRIARWNAAMAIWLGLAIGLSIHSAGLLYSFGCLVLPGLIAKQLCREIGPMYAVAPAVALAAAAAGFIVANHYDSPPAQMTVALLSAALAIAWGVRRLRLAGSA